MGTMLEGMEDIMGEGSLGEGMEEEGDAEEGVEMGAVEGEEEEVVKHSEV